jgi:RNA polymerase sigma factor (sigma-70 family)
MKGREEGKVKARTWDAPTSSDVQSPTELSDEHIVTMALDDRSYFRLLYQRYADRIYWFATARSGSEAVADDVVSESMLAALENLERWDPKRGTFATWLFVIAQRKVIDQQRSYQRMRRLLARVQSFREPQSEPDSLEWVLEQEQALKVREALRRLPRRDREIIALRFGAGLSGEEIAVVLGISHVAARKRLSRAQQRLARRLERRPDA